MLVTLTEKLRFGHELTSADVVTACESLFDESVELSERADFLRALHAKGETASEVVGFVDVLLTRSRRSRARSLLAGRLRNGRRQGWDFQRFYCASCS